MQHPLPASRHAFTLIELLVVISIIALLIALLLPALGRARYTARVSNCTMNYHQYALASVAYANDQDGYLIGASKGNTAFNLPGGIGPNPSGVTVYFLEQLEDYGATHEFWFCPARDRRATNFTPEVTATDRDGVVDELTIFSSSWAVFPHFWWTPRKAGSMPIPYYTTATQPSTWFPERLSSLGISSMPIASDYVQTDTSSLYIDDPLYSFGGHRYGDLFESSNSAYGDGHVETKPASALEANVAIHWWNWY